MMRADTRTRPTTPAKRPARRESAPRAGEPDGDPAPVGADAVSGQLLGDLLELGGAHIVELERHHPLAHSAGAHPEGNARATGGRLAYGRLGVGRGAAEHPRRAA